jgi:hypothetical protein
MLLVGGTAMIPNFQARFHQECIRTAGEHPRYRVLQRLVDKMRFLSGGERGRVFPANCRTWIGGKFLINNILQSLINLLIQPVFMSIIYRLTCRCYQVGWSRDYKR